jgi:hypothetical protein
MKAPIFAQHAIGNKAMNPHPVTTFLLLLMLVASPSFASEQVDSLPIAKGIATLAKSNKHIDQRAVEKAFGVAFEKLDLSAPNKEPNSAPFELSKYWTTFVPRQAGTGILVLGLNIGRPHPPNVQINLSPNVCLLGSDLEKSIGAKAIKRPYPVSSRGEQTSPNNSSAGPGDTWLISFESRSMVQFTSRRSNSECLAHVILSVPNDERSSLKPSP